VQTNEDHWRTPAPEEDITDSMPRRLQSLRWARTASKGEGVFRRQDLHAFLRLDQIEDVTCTVYSSLLCPTLSAGQDHATLYSECFLPSEEYTSAVLAKRVAATQRASGMRYFVFAVATLLVLGVTVRQFCT
jgi:hypothetical protein